MLRTTLALALVAVVPLAAAPQELSLPIRRLGIDVGTVGGPPVFVHTRIGRLPDSMDLSDRLAEPDCPNVLAVEPLVLVNVSGSTLLGAVQELLVVYSDGSVSFSGLSEHGMQEGVLRQDGSSPPTGASARAINIGAVEAKQFAADLERAGARRLCDQQAMYTDVPLHTVTILSGRTNSASHTFSYWVGVEEYSDVALVLNDFIATYF